jgi:hypothetical protein
LRELIGQASRASKATCEKISAAVQRDVKMLDVAERFNEAGATAVGDSPEHVAKYLKVNNARWRAVVDAGVKIE